eukprot:TRINITY_DN8692_c0_g1_i1.p1 TRINITY_DN8692_c0_g1~~TRINITY_DN8692_c0_g1_i1.p1  ORF type:complete len:543 (+),score=107.76 TRINITY_DN8692_c0_g1_i1:53-1630(+)
MNTTQMLILLIFGVLIVNSNARVFDDGWKRVDFTFDYYMLYKISDVGDRKVINATLTLFQEAWMAVGFSPVTGGMPKSDIILARFDGIVPKVEDRYSDSHTAPTFDTTLGGTDNILWFEFEQGDGKTVASFSRYLDTGDTKTDHVISLGENNMIWATGQGNQFGYHGVERRAQTCIVLETGHHCEPPISSLKVPKGFKIEKFAEVQHARTMTLNDYGHLFIGTMQLNNIYALHIDNPEKVFTLGNNFNVPNGVATIGNSLFVAEPTKIIRYDGISSSLPNLPKGKVIHEFEAPPSPQHQWKHLQFGPDGRLFTSVNSPCNTCYNHDYYGTIIAMYANGSSLEIISRGVRDTQGFDFHPDTNQLWWTDNGRDNWGNQKPPDELNRVSETGLHYGFPYCYGKDIVDPDYNLDGNCNKYVPCALELDAHTAALGMKFYNGKMFPPEYRKSIFIAEHGSWNRHPPFGYRIMNVQLDDNYNPISYNVFAEGWLQDQVTSGRPVDVLVMPDGSLLVSDDYAGLIYRISYDP